ncbi:MAG: hypothetical protein ACFCUR_01210 [Rhodomicrobiaceae bacterium]
MRYLDSLILPTLENAQTISWRSPIAADEFAEYRDTAFLEKIGASDLATELVAFWPRHGPQWDALACSDAGHILLVEAKAHIDELCSPPTGAGDVSRAMIQNALSETAAYLGARPIAPWTDAFYQVANRIAHLHFLRKHGKPAWLILVNFTGDLDMNGPASQAEWEAAYRVVWHVLGLNRQHALARYIVHVYPVVTNFSD